MGKPVVDISNIVQLGLTKIAEKAQEKVEAKINGVVEDIQELDESIFEMKEDYIDHLEVVSDYVLDNNSVIDGLLYANNVIDITEQLSIKIDNSQILSPIERDALNEAVAILSEKSSDLIYDIEKIIIDDGIGSLLSTDKSKLTDQERLDRVYSFTKSMSELKRLSKELESSINFKLENREANKKSDNKLNELFGK